MGAVLTDSRKNRPADGKAALEGIENAVGAGQSARPVHLWNPPFLGEIDIRIAADGTWYHLGTPILREPLVRLFASILRREEDGTVCLVTPVEKFAIRVDDVPFQAIEMSVEGKGRNQIISFRTNMDDRVRVDRDHAMRFATCAARGDTRPYVMVRDGLEALITRAVFYDLVDLGTTHDVAGSERFGVWSCGEFFAMADAAELEL